MEKKILPNQDAGRTMHDEHEEQEFIREGVHTVVKISIQAACHITVAQNIFRLTRSAASSQRRAKGFQD